MADSESHQSRSPSPSNKKREQADENTCLYIGNIDKRLSQQTLVSVFAQYGDLEYCYIVYEPYSISDRSSKTEPKQSRGYGFAKYVNSKDAIVAKNKLHGTDLNGRKITVEISKRNKPREPTPGQYLGKKRQSPPPHRSHRRSYSRSSSRSRSKSHRKSKRYHDRHDKKRRHQRSRSRSRSRSVSHRRRRSSYSRSPRR